MCDEFVIDGDVGTLEVDAPWPSEPGAKEARMVDSHPKMDAPAPRPANTRPAERRRPPFFFDLETVPDFERLELFDLPPVPGEPEPRVLEPDECETILSGTIPMITAALADVIGATPDSVALLKETEAEGKNRKGVLDAIDNLAVERKKLAEGQNERNKLLATTPEFCSICAMGFAMGDEAVRVCMIGENVSEVKILETFWDAVGSTQGPVIGYNIAGFDLPVIFARSILLGVRPTRKFDLRPWGGDVVDLYLSRFPKGAGGNGRPGKLKQLAKLYGIHVPAGDCDGSEVLGLLKSSPAKLAEYVASDVTITRALWQDFRGFFC